MLALIPLFIIRACACGLEANVDAIYITCRAGHFHGLIWNGIGTTASTVNDKHPADSIRKLGCLNVQRGQSTVEKWHDLISQGRISGPIS